MEIKLEKGKLLPFDKLYTQLKDKYFFGVIYENPNPEGEHPLATVGLFEKLVCSENQPERYILFAHNLKDIYEPSEIGKLAVPRIRSPEFVTIELSDQKNKGLARDDLLIYSTENDFINGLASNKNPNLRKYAAFFQRG